MDKVQITTLSDLNSLKLTMVPNNKRAREEFNASLKKPPTYTLPKMFSKDDSIVRACKAVYDTKYYNTSTIQFVNTIIDTDTHVYKHKPTHKWDNTYIETVDINNVFIINDDDDMERFEVMLAGFRKLKFANTIRTYIIKNSAECKYHDGVTTKDIINTLSKYQTLTKYRKWDASLKQHVESKDPVNIERYKKYNIFINPVKDYTIESYGFLTSSGVTGFTLTDCSVSKFSAIKEFYGDLELQVTVPLSNGINSDFIKYIYGVYLMKKNTGIENLIVVNKYAKFDKIRDPCDNEKIITDIDCDSIIQSTAEIEKTLTLEEFMEIFKPSSYAHTSLNITSDVRTIYNGHLQKKKNILLSTLCGNRTMFDDDDDDKSVFYNKLFTVDYQIHSINIDNYISLDDDEQPDRFSVYEIGSIIKGIYGIKDIGNTT